MSSKTAEKAFLAGCRELEAMNLELFRRLGPPTDDLPARFNARINELSKAGHVTCPDLYLVVPMTIGMGCGLVWGILMPGTPHMGAYGYPERKFLLHHHPSTSTHLTWYEDLDTALDLAAALNIGRKARLEQKLEPRRAKK